MLVIVHNILGSWESVAAGRPFVLGSVAGNEAF
jgi:hypothetical protein